MANNVCSFTLKVTLTITKLFLFIFQDNIRLHCQDVCQMMLEEDAYLFVCGDAASMARDVLSVIVDSIAKYKGQCSDRIFFYHSLNYVFLT